MQGSLSSQKCAREIMGSSYFGLEECYAYYGIIPSKEQSASLMLVPYPADVLEAVKESHILVAMCPFVMYDIFKHIQKMGNSAAYKLMIAQEGTDVNSLLSFSGKENWFLIRKNPVPGSLGKIYRRQMEMLSRL